MIYRTTTYIVGLLAGLCCLSPASVDPLGDLLSSAGGGVSGRPHQYGHTSPYRRCVIYRTGLVLSRILP